jgi:hypothetical protein
VQLSRRERRNNTLRAPVAPVPSSSPTLAPVVPTPTPTVAVPERKESETKTFLNRIQATLNASLNAAQSAPPVQANQPAQAPPAPVAAHVPVPVPVPVSAPAQAPVPSAPVKSQQQSSPPAESKHEVKDDKIKHEIQLSTLDSQRVAVSRAASIDSSNADVKAKMVKQVMDRIPKNTVSEKNISFVLDTILALVSEIGPLNMVQVLMPLCQLVVQLPGLKKLPNTQLMIVSEIYKALVYVAYGGRVPQDMSVQAAHTLPQILPLVLAVSKDKNLTEQFRESLQAQQKAKRQAKKGCCA